MQQAYCGDEASTALWNMWQHQQLQQQQQQAYKANGTADGEVFAAGPPPYR
jgi:hypothetical protein